MRIPMIAAAAAVALTVSAGAAPVPGNIPLAAANGSVSGMGDDVQAVFLYYDAADTDDLEITVPVLMPLFRNKTSAIGTTIDMGLLMGPLQFALTDRHGSGPGDDKTFFSDTADNQGNFHAWFTTDYSDFNVGAMLGSADAALDALAPGATIVYVGWEDLTFGSDWDYNDLIFAVAVYAPDENPGVPEPLTLSLLGAGLMGIFGLRRIKKA